MAIDAGEFRSGNVGATLRCLEQWDEIFQVFSRQPEDGRARDAVAGPSDAAAAYTMSSSEVEGKLRERAEARRQRNFTLADRIREELSAAGILMEDTKDGVRWKRK